MASTILLTGANSSLGIPTVDYLLKHHTESSLVLTVRDAGDQDPNTKTLRAVIAVYPEARVSIRELDLTNLDAVRKLARSMKQDVASGAIPPLSAIVGNAYYWNLARPMEMTGDGYEKTMQVSYLSHVALVLVLITSFLPQGGRIVQFSSDGHESGKNPLEKFPPKIPSDPNQLDLLVKPAPDATNDVTGHGFHRYANSKLATVMFTHALNRRLQRDSQLKHITAIVMNPGNLFDSRALVVNTPLKLILLSKLVLRPMGKIFGISELIPMFTCCRPSLYFLARLKTFSAKTKLTNLHIKNWTQRADPQLQPQ